ncbi:urease accessory protein UreE [Kaistia terrae]|uniref:Urease accessory protein UreE n=1 Tax=Kaistia terrae TaxID=537017 RepID=A0ABW0PQ68_9HYPH|nr:urease accessory protein UreE [Kaistia terrae]MCX5577875.1 urease accessory protein UreE [Kaistia terrae]
MLKAIAVTRASDIAAEGQEPVSGRAVLQHDERHLRRRLIELVDGRKVMVDLPETVVLDAGDRLVLSDGGRVEIAAAYEPLYEIFGQDPVHLSQLAWHIGNRHLAAAIEPTRILILRDHVIKAMLEGLGARVKEIVAQFNPVRGAYSGHGDPSHGQDHGSHSHAAHGASHGEHSHAHGDHSHSHAHGDKHHSHDHDHDHGHDHGPGEHRHG